MKTLFQIEWHPARLRWQAWTRRDHQFECNESLVSQKLSFRAGRAIRVGTWAKFLLLLYLVATDANALLRIDGTFQSRHFRVGSGRSEKQNSI